MRRESFSKPFTPEQVRQEFAYGVQEYLRQKLEGPISGQEVISYNSEKAEFPILRQQFEQEIKDFLDLNFKEITSVIVNSKVENEFNKFKVLNKDLRNFGFNDTSIVVEALTKNDDYGDYHTISKMENRGRGVYTDEISDSEAEEFNYDLLEKHKSYGYKDMRINYPDFGDKESKFRELSEILATGYLKDRIKINSKMEAGESNSNHTQRYLYKDSGRYLCENDFGMKPYDGEADVSNITPFAESVQRQIRQTLSNLEIITEIINSRNKFKDDHDFRDLRIELLAEHQLPQELNRNDPDYEENKRIRRNIFDLVAKEIDKKVRQANKIIQNEREIGLSDAFESPLIKDLIFNAIPYAKFINEIATKRNNEIENIIEADLEGESDLYKKLEYFQSNKFREQIKNSILRDSYNLPQLGDKLIYKSVAHGKPVILKEGTEVSEILNIVANGYKETAKYNIIEASSDERLKKIVKMTGSGRGEGSPYSFHSFDLYEAVRKLGVDTFLGVYPKIAETVLEGNQHYWDLNFNQFIGGVENLYKIFGNKISEMEPDKLKKEIWHTSALENSLIWNYFQERETGIKEEGSSFRGSDYYRSHEAHYFDSISQAKRKKLFFEGKQMYWLAKQVQTRVFEINKNKNIGHQEDENNDADNEYKFHEHSRGMKWEQYDCKNVDLEKLSKYLVTHGNIICTLLGDDNGQIATKINVETIMQVVEAIESGADMRGVALAFDKRKYIDGVLSGKEQKNDLEYALKDWPKELRSTISNEEFKLYFENAEQYLYQDPNGMIRYSKILLAEPRIRELLDGKIEKKSDLDLRLCLTAQDQEVRSWYFEGAEYIGHKALQSYFVRFNATKEQVGGYANLHDALYWIPKIKKVSPDEAKALLNDITTIDESNELRDFLTRYDKNNDALAKDGTIQSLRELKKRVFSIEANIDISTLTPEMLDIISAPGFNMVTLKNLQTEARFEDLISGKLDREQPFGPHKRTFTARPLNELLLEGLGSFKEKIRGTAQDPKGLFDSVRRLIQTREINGKQIQIQNLLNDVPIDMEEEILQLLQEQRVPTGVLLEATVHAKSDPEGWVCGNYTDCCMSFGESKNTDYMYNKGTQYFTVKYNNRIIAQSVIVDSIDSKNNEKVIILDNIEVANNYKNQAPVLSKIYKTFWAEYTSMPVKIGTGHSDLIPDNASLVKNTFFPKYPLEYSDAVGEHIYNLPKIKGIESIDKILTFTNIEERDAVTIAEMEKEVYPDGMVQGKGNALEVIRKTRELNLPGAASSFILRQGREPAGYLLVLPEESEINNQETVAHIYDMAVLPKFQGGTVARKMMERMLETAKAYNVPAIEFEARDSTSYRLIINNRVQKWIESKGFKLAYNELLPEYLNGEDFYYVRLEKIPNQE